MTISSGDNTLLEVPSRQKLEEESFGIIREREIENASEDFVASDNDTAGDVEESDLDEEDFKAFSEQAFKAFINEEKLNKYTDELGAVRGLMKYLDENIQTWITRRLKIAVIGNAGTGKSSLINAIRGLKPDDKGAARVGVTETTFGIQQYLHPSNENISLWDLPGVGTQNFKKEDYLKTVNLENFDVFLIVSASRFTENDIWLATEILKYQGCVLFLRTKIDQDLSNHESDYPSTYNEAKCLQNIRMEIVKYLKKANIPHKRSGIYLISSKKTSKYDFTNLVNRLNGILSKKRFALKGVIEHHLQEILSRKRDRKKGQFIFSKVSLLFGVGCKYEHTRRMYDNCKAAFSLDDKTLELISQEIGMSVEHLKTEELTFFKDFAKPLADTSNRPLSFFSFGFRFFTKQLNDVCDALAKDEAQLISLRLEYLEKQLQPL